MQVALLGRVANLGSLDDQVDAEAGYARNFLVPRGRVVPAIKKNAGFFKARCAELEVKPVNALSAAETHAAQINALESAIIASKAGDRGELLGSIDAHGIADVVTAAGVKVVKSEVRLLNGVLRDVGERKVDLQIYSEIFAKIITNAVAE